MLNVPLASAVWTANDTFKSVPLEGGIFLRELVVEHSITVNWDAAKTLFIDALGRGFRLNLFLADSNPVMSARVDVWKNFQESLDQVAPDYTELTAAGAGNVTGTFRIVIPFADPQLPKPDDTAYDMALAKSPRLDINFDGLAAFTATALGASAVVSQQTDVVMRGVQRPAGLPARQSTILRRYKQYGLLGTSDIPAGTNDGRFLKLDLGGLIRRVLVQTKESTSATKPPLNTLLTKLGWYINGNKYGLATFTALRAAQRVEKHVVPPTGTVLLDFDLSSEIDPRELLSLAGVDGTAGVEVASAAALANGLEVAYLEESVIFPPMATT